MLIVKLEVWPHGDEKAAREIGRATITNVGGDQRLGEYTAEVIEDGASRATVRMLNWPRTRKKAWDLITAVLRPVCPDFAICKVCGDEYTDACDCQVSAGGTRFDTSHKDAPVCPHCGKTVASIVPRYRVVDVDDRIAVHDMTGHFDCDECDQEMLVTRHVTVTYSTRKT